MVDRATSVVVTIGFEVVYIVMHIPEMPFSVVPRKVYDGWSNMADNNTTLIKKRVVKHFDISVCKW